ncbi:MAG: class I SAM-dependent methyltransferase [Roseiarcus sp.]|jgi:SAM-dependent methyltransferase
MDYLAQWSEPFPGEASERERRVARRLSGAPFLAEPLRRIGYDSSEGWAWDHYRAVVLALAQACRRSGRRDDAPARVLEIGGGRGPLLTPAEAAAAGVALTVNDIDARELSLAPDAFDKAQFDVAGDIDPTWEGRFDLIISRMVFEHVRDAPRAWANMRALLAPGGVALAFHPTLYAPPFVINSLLPESLAARALRFFFPVRHDAGYPKFPTRYEMCFSDPAKIEPILRRCGFSEVLVAPFWRHGYFRHIPLLREVDAALQHLAEKRDWRSLSTYAYTLARR